MRAVESRGALYDCRDAYARALLEIAQADARVVVVVNDSVGSSKLGKFFGEYPDRSFNVGIAEQNLIGVGAGLANGGRIPFVCGASPFLTGRGLEQIKVDAAYSNANIKLVGVSSGLAYGALGPTHHSIEDLAWTRAIANLTIIVPADPIETEQAIHAAHQTDGPFFIRTSRMPVPNVHPPDYVFEIGKAAMLRDGRDVTIIANGIMVSRAIDAADLLESSGISVRVLNMATLAPLDHAAIVDAARSTGRIVTVEEHTTRGGLGGAVAEVVVSEYPVPMRILGVPGVFAPTGSTEFLLDYFGLTADGIRSAALDLVAARRAP
ncbi:MAG: transketolase family protein [Candidatus Limnocylindrales bacterium]